MTFLGLILHNVWSRKARSFFTAVAVAFGVGTVVTLGVVTSSLKTTAVQVLRTGDADFTVAQKGVSDVLNSVMDEQELADIRSVPGVEQVIGVLLNVIPYDADNPVFIEIGLQPEELAGFGVDILEGRIFGAGAEDEVMLGFRAAENFGKEVGDTIDLDGDVFEVVGLYRTSNDIGNTASMMPINPMRARLRLPGNVTIILVQTADGADVDAIRSRIEEESPNLVTVKTEEEFGRVDRNLQLISAADRGAVLVALLVGAVIVSNTMLLSFFERIREFGVLRGIGWSRRRVVTLVFLEALVLSIGGAALGVALSFLGTRLLQEVSELRGVLEPEYDAAIFWRALYVAVGVGLLGAIYPAMRAALLKPLEALRRE